MTYLENSKQNDSVSPGEQCFFYWKTSASLWEGKIIQCPQHEVIFIPLYWGFHAESATEWDFGSLRPERDLLRLTQLLTQHARKFCWILPLTPVPFLPNGGVPAFAARTLSLAREGVHLAVFDQEHNLNKMFSYFGPKVFQAFNTFLKHFSSFLAEHKIKAPVWGTKYLYHEEGRSISFLEDHSLAFEQGFSRYLKQNTHDGQELTEPNKESAIKETFTKEVGNLFLTTAETTLAPYWSGIKNVVVLGASPKETILRSLKCGKSQLEYTHDLFRHYVRDEWISSVLLSPEEKKGTISQVLKEHFGPDKIDHQFKYQSYSPELSEEFRPFGIIDIYGGMKQHHFEKTGLLSFLDSHFRWLYHVKTELVFTPASIDIDHHKIKFFHGTDLDRVTFGQILKLFMMGQKILLDRSGLSDGLDKKLQIFLLENNLKNQSVNFMTTCQICELGEGRLILFEGNRLLENPSKEKFWMNILKYLNLVQPQMLMDEDVFSMWSIRGTSPHELSYLDVRRVNIYNPTSYKKVVSIKTQKHFAFMKTIDPTRATAKSTSDGVDVELLPNGKIALDFGHYEET